MKKVYCDNYYCRNNYDGLCTMHELSLKWIDNDTIECQSIIMEEGEEEKEEEEEGFINNY